MRDGGETVKNGLAIGLQFWVITKFGHAEHLGPNERHWLVNESGNILTPQYTHERKHVWEY
jgi:hypothetical protein